MHSRKRRRKLQFLITAGGTREYIDPVRFISNASSGKMGYELARAVISAGHKVILITTIENSKFRIKNSKLKTITVETAAQMFGVVKKYFSRCDCLIMAAAVSDYTPVKKSKIKIQKSNRNFAIKLKPTADILKWAGSCKRPNQAVVGFALEDRGIKAGAERKMREKKMDMVIANAPAAIGAEQSEVFVKTAGKKWLKIARSPKRLIARRLMAMVQSLIPRSSLVNSDSNL